MYDDFYWTKISKSRNALTQAYEPLQIDFLNALVKREKNCIFLDIGANIGVYSVILSGNTNIDEIIAFEALPECAEEIRKNLALNHLERRVKVVEAALSDLPREVNFLRTKAHGGDSAIMDTYLFGRHEKDQVIKMLTVTLDDTVNLETKAVVRKIDVEGHELNVLRGAKRVLSSSKGWIQCEIHDRSPFREEVFEFLSSHGWKKVFRLGWDYYFTNQKQFFDAGVALETVEVLLDSYIDGHRMPTVSKPARREIAPGITLEVSRKKVDLIKKFFIWRKHT